MSFVSEKAVKAVRKSARCDACGQMVDIGQPAVRWAGVQDGDFYSLLYHPECRAAEIEWNRENGSFWDDWTGLSDLDWDEWPWLLERHHEVAARLGITAERYAEIEAEQARCRSAISKALGTNEATNMRGREG